MGNMTRYSLLKVSKRGFSIVIDCKGNEHDMEYIIFNHVSFGFTATKT